MMFLYHIFVTSHTISSLQQEKISIMLFSSPSIDYLLSLYNEFQRYYHQISMNHLNSRPKKTFSKNFLKIFCFSTIFQKSKKKNFREFSQNFSNFSNFFLEFCQNTKPFASKQTLIFLIFSSNLGKLCQSDQSKHLPFQ